MKQKKMFIKLLVVTSVYVTAGVEAKSADTFFQKTKSQGTLVQRTHYQKSSVKIQKGCFGFTG